MIVCNKSSKSSWKLPTLLAIGLLFLLSRVIVPNLLGGQEAPANPAPANQSPASSASGAKAGDQDKPPQTFRVKVEEVQIPFSVYDKKGNLVLDLQKEDFSIYEDGVQQDIRYFSGPTNLPLRFGLLLDTSSSTRPRLKFEKEAAMELGYYVLTKNKDKDHLGFVMQFDHTPQVIQDFTPDPDDLTTALDGLEASGGTALLDAIIEACEKKLMTSPGPGLPRRVLVIFSDGDDNLSKHSLEQTVEIALLSDVRIFAVSANGYGQAAPGEEVLKKLVEETGGRLYSPLENLAGAAFATGYESKHQLYESQNSIYTPGSGEYQSDVAVAMTTALESIGDELTHQYAIGYIPKNPDTDKNFRPIEIRTRRKGVEIRTKKGYYAAH